MITDLTKHVKRVYFYLYYQAFILAIEADSFLSRNRTRCVSVINMGPLALPLDVTWQSAPSNSILNGLAM